MFRFWKIYLLHKPRLYVYLLLDVLSQLCSLAEPYLLGLTVNVLAAKNGLGISLRTLVLCVFAIGVVALIMLMNINIAMAIACLACIVTGAVVYRLFSGLLFNRGFEFQEKTAAFYGTLQSQLESVSFLRRHSLFDFYSLRLQKAFDGLYPAILANKKPDHGSNLRIS